MANCVVIADDENLELAVEYGFEGIEMDNSLVGRKVNVGFMLAAEYDADYMAFVGSDDWLHADLFQPLLQGFDGVVAGREITLVDLPRGVMTQMNTDRAIPWLIPRAALEPCSFRPVPDHFSRGLDHPVWYQLQEQEWLFHDPHPQTRVDFKSHTNITPYSQIGRSRGTGPEQPLYALEAWYPEQLVDLAEEISRGLSDAG